MVTAPTCNFLRVFCEKSAVFCEKCGVSAEMLEFPGEGAKLRKSAVFGENLHFGLSLLP